MTLITDLATSITLVCNMLKNMRHVHKCYLQSCSVLTSCLRAEPFMKTVSLSQFSHCLNFPTVSTFPESGTFPTSHRIFPHKFPKILNFPGKVSILLFFLGWWVGCNCGCKRAALFLYSLPAPSPTQNDEYFMKF